MTNMKTYQKIAITLSLGLSLLGCGGVGSDATDTKDLPIAVDDTASVEGNADAIAILVLSNDTPQNQLDSNTVKIIDNPDNGTASAIATGEIKYQPNLNYIGTDSLVYTVQDTDGNFSNPATVTITILEDTPAFIIKIDTRNPITFASGGTGDTKFHIPTKGTGYNYNVDCGDGSALITGITSGYTCKYATPNEYTINITGTFPQIYFTNPPLDNEKLNSIEQWGGQKWRSMSHAFQFCKNMTSNAIDIPDLSLVKDMSFMFLDAESFKQENIRDWDVSTVTDMQYLFYKAYEFNNDITSWVVDSVTNMDHMFWHAEKFNQNIGSWAVDNVTNMRAMFQYARAFNQNIGGWNVNLVDDVSSMFRGATLFNADISGWFDNFQIGRVTKMHSMFRDAKAFDQDIGGWNVSGVIAMELMFLGADSFTTANYDNLLNGWFSLPSLQNDVNFSAGNTKYSILASENRGLIILNYNWTITDGGEAP